MPPPLVFLTADTPGIGGVIKQRDEDFLVDEQPLYEPTGAGEHLMLFIEKHGMTTSDLVRRLAKAFQVGRSEIGYAGLKDKRAVSRQHFTVRLTDPSRDAELLTHIDWPNVKLLWAQRHANKLRRGHLAGNRFVIRIRAVEPTAVVGAKRVLDRLEAGGVPNYIGEQRFGYRGDNAQLGRLLLAGKWQEMLDLMLGQPRPGDYAATHAGREAYDRHDYAGALNIWPRHMRHERQALDALRQGRSPQQAVMAIDYQQREFVISALQSDIFNRVLHRRITDGLFARLVPGDLAWKHGTRAVFHVDQDVATLENGPEGRVPRLEVSPSGPMWGTDMIKPTDEPARWELEALEALGVGEADLVGGRQGTAAGARRPLRVPLRNADISGGADEHGPYIRLAFDLPRGCFATTVLREITKNEVVEGAADATEPPESPEPPELPEMESEA